MGAYVSIATFAKMAGISKAEAYKLFNAKEYACYTDIVEGSKVLDTDLLEVLHDAKKKVVSNPTPKEEKPAEVKGTPHAQQPANYPVVNPEVEELKKEIVRLQAQLETDNLHAELVSLREELKRKDLLIDDYKAKIDDYTKKVEDYATKFAELATQAQQIAGQAQYLQAKSENKLLESPEDATKRRSLWERLRGKK